MPGCGWPRILNPTFSSSNPQSLNPISSSPESQPHLLLSVLFGLSISSLPLRTLNPIASSWLARSLTDDLKGIQEELRTNYFNYPALPPPMPWLDDTPPPGVSLHGGVLGWSVELLWDRPVFPPGQEDDLRAFVVYRFEGDVQVDGSLTLSDPAFIRGIVPADARGGKKLEHFVFEEDLVPACVTYVVTSVDRLSNEGLSPEARMTVGCTSLPVAVQA
jgi:hypothetical protein